MALLLQRPAPYSDESLESYFIRVANKNGYTDISRFLATLKRFLNDINSYQFQSFPTDICQLNPCSSKNHSGSRTHALHLISQMTFNEPADLLSIAINRSAMKFSPNVTGLVRNAEVIPRKLLRNESIPCCPICLQQKGYANYHWHFTGYDYCHEHKTKLTYQCACGVSYDYRHCGLSGLCSECGAQITALEDKDCSWSQMVASWLAGEKISPLPTVPKSYRWGLLHWWQEMTDEKDNTKAFVHFWQHWPNSFHQMIETEIAFNLDHAIVSRSELRVKDVLGKLFFSSILLPERNFNANIVLKSLFQYLEAHLWENHGLLANLRMNALDLCVLLNCSRDQVASMVEQGVIIPNRQLKSNSPLNVKDYLFHLGDIYCLWIAEFQTDEFNRSFYVSRW